MNKYYGLKPGTVGKQESEHTAVVRDAAARGMVLLEHDGTLPLKEHSKIALYGFGAETRYSAVLEQQALQAVKRSPLRKDWNGQGLW